MPLPAFGAIDYFSDMLASGALMPLAIRSLLPLLRFFFSPPYYAADFRCYAAAIVIILHAYADAFLSLSLRFLF